MAHKHWKLVEEEEPAHGKCPHCGYCSCCGRSAFTPFYPSYPYTAPYYPIGPVWVSSSAGNVTGVSSPAITSSTTIIS